MVRAAFSLHVERLRFSDEHPLPDGSPRHFCPVAPTPPALETGTGVTSPLFSLQDCPFLWRRPRTSLPSPYVPPKRPLSLISAVSCVRFRHLHAEQVRRHEAQRSGQDHQKRPTHETIRRPEQLYGVRKNQTLFQSGRGQSFPSARARADRPKALRC